mgnify:FL=1
MTKIVRKRANPTTIWFDGVWGVPSACLRKEKTITNRVKEVVMINNAGASVSRVSRNTICRVVATWEGVSAWSTLILIPGMGDCACKVPISDKTKGIRMQAHQKFRFNVVKIRNYRIGFKVFSLEVSFSANLSMVEPSRSIVLTG